MLHVVCCMLQLRAIAQQGHRIDNLSVHCSPCHALRPQSPHSHTWKWRTRACARTSRHSTKPSRALQHCARGGAAFESTASVPAGFHLDCRMQVMESRRVPKSGCCVLHAACCVLFAACLLRHACSISCEPKYLIASAHPAAHSTCYLINHTRIPRNQSAFRD